MSCDNRRREEQLGRDAARFGRGGFEHDERIRNARWEPDSCDYYYAQGFESERRQIDDQARQEREREEAEEYAAHQAAMAEAEAEQEEYERAMDEEQ